MTQTRINASRWNLRETNINGNKNNRHLIPKYPKHFFLKKKKPELTVWSRQPYGSVFVIPRDNIQNPGQYR